MRLSRIQEYMTQRGMRYAYREEDDCGTIEFDHRGLHYHIWEYPARSGARKATSCPPAAPLSTRAITRTPSWRF